MAGVDDYSITRHALVFRKTGAFDEKVTDLRDDIDIVWSSKPFARCSLAVGDDERCSCGRDYLGHEWVVEPRCVINRIGPDIDRLTCHFCPAGINGDHCVRLVNLLSQRRERNRADIKPISALPQCVLCGFKSLTELKCTSAIVE